MTLPLQPIHLSRRNRLGRLLWGVVAALLFRWTPRPAHAWRAWLLARFGARMGRRCHVYAGARIWAPWNLTCEDDAAIADGAEIYNLAPVHLGVHSVVSQGAFLCTATHDMHDPAFPLRVAPIRVARRGWVAARAVVLPGVTLGEGAVLGLGALATHDLPPWSVHAGVPARAVGRREPH